ncbi:hypothetical protein H0W32_03290, partial [Patescibacteria group bacterium]|nr:hypothetical protein [Patescibacteria group bacterium]
VMAARPATLIKALHRDYCGTVDNLIISGHSGGSAQCAYSLAHYGLDAIVKTVGFTGGVPFTSMSKVGAGEATYWNIETSDKVDRTYGYPGLQNGPCNQQLTTDNWPARWLRDQVNQAGRDFKWPGVYIYALWGENDTTGTPEAAMDLMALLRTNGMTPITEVIPAMGHGTSPDVNGLVRYEYALRREPLYSQSKLGIIQPGTALKVTFNKLPHVGTLMVAAVRANTISANVETPVGWSRDLALDYASNSHALVVFSKVAGAADVVTTTVNITNKQLTSDVSTLTTATPHGFTVGMSVKVVGVDATFDGVHTITVVGSTTTFSYKMVPPGFYADVASTPATGTATNTGPGVDITTLVSATTHVQIVEVFHLLNAVLDRTASGIASPAAGGTILAPATLETTADKEWAITVIATQNASLMSEWTDGFVGIGSVTARIKVATRTLRATETLEGGATSSTANNVAIGVLSYKAAV